MCQIERWKMLSLQGPDALDFLERLSTNQVTAELRMHLFLDRTGKILCWAITRRMETAIALYAPAQLIDVLKAHLNASHFLEDIEISEPKDVIVVQRLCSGQATHAQSTAINIISPIDSNIYVEVSIESSSEEDRPHSPIEPIEDDAKRWLAMLNKNALPLLTSEWSINAFPLEIGLREAIDWSKGCFPGQEVVSRQLLKEKQSQNQLCFS